MNVWYHAPAALWRRCSQAVLILPPDHDEVLLLDGMGAAIWEVLERPSSVAGIVATLTESRGVGPDAIEEQVTRFLEELLEFRAVARR